MLWFAAGANLREHGLSPFGLRVSWKVLSRAQPLRSRVPWVFNPRDRTRTSPKQHPPHLLGMSAPQHQLCPFTYQCLQVCTTCYGRRSLQWKAQLYALAYSLIFGHHSGTWPRAVRVEQKHIETNWSQGACINLAHGPLRRRRGYAPGLWLGHQRAGALAVEYLVGFSVRVLLTFEDSLCVFPPPEEKQKQRG